MSSYFMGGGHIALLVQQLILLARAYYPSGDDYIPWTADMVAGFSLDGKNGSIKLTHNTTNENGYRCVLDETITTAWDNRHCSYAVASRHLGTGILSFAINAGSSSTNITDVTLEFSGSANMMYEDAWIAIVNKNNVKLYAKMQDYNTTQLACLQNMGFKLMTNGPWVTALPSGTQYKVSINHSEVVVSSSQPTNSNAKIWVKI